MSWFFSGWLQRLAAVLNFTTLNFKGLKSQNMIIILDDNPTLVAG